MPQAHSPDLFDRLDQLARNYWWSWNPDVASIFRDLDPALWNEVNHNPILLLQRIDRAGVMDRVRQLALESRVVYALRRLTDYQRGDRTYGMFHAGPILARPVAYFSAEFGVHESLPNYAGGLGVLAGDHVKAASDLGIPLVGVGLFYVEGYFRQSVDDHGRQKETYGDVDVNLTPMRRAVDDAGKPVLVEIDTPEGVLKAGIWQAPIGRNQLLLLDANVEGNSAEDRKLTARLYGGDDRVRLRQEILLGIGGVRALRALGITPSVYHMNEGHSAFATLEVIRGRMVHDGLTFEDAVREVSMRTVFTTHTPVPAGHDRFSAELIEAHLGTFRKELGLSAKALMALGRVDPEESASKFGMTVLALKTSRHANGVSNLHGHVSRKMWHPLWEGRPEQEVPIGHITNGVHVGTWLAPQMHRVYERFLPQNWTRRLHDPQAWAGIMDIEDGELWEAKQVIRSRLVDYTRRRTGNPSCLDPYALTLGFARRFATYKRGVLMFTDLERIEALLNDPNRPVQILFSGKAHPKDEPGKAFIQQIYKLSKDKRFAGKVVFLEDYDIGVGRNLVHGVDGWVNNPRRPLEACGTSGQKVVLNGGLNISVLDGWWAEAYDGTNGFAIGGEDVHVDAEIQDARDAESLYQVLEQQVIPLFYDRDESGVPHGWVWRMKRALTTCGWRYSADRMVIDYLHTSYLPAAGALQK